MRHLLAEWPALALLEQLRSRACRLKACQWLAASYRPTDDPAHRRPSAQQPNGLLYVGAVPPLGRLDPPMLRGMPRNWRAQFGDGSLRFTPWQSLLLPNVRTRLTPPKSLQASRRNSACSDPMPPNRISRLIACTGSNGCGKGLADTKQDARQLATLLSSGQSVHLSGCSRSCAAAHRAPVTLLAVGPGHYDLYFRDATQPGFGALHAHNLTIEAVATLLDARSWSPLDA
jgi:precorrin-3B synthase